MNNTIQHNGKKIFIDTFTINGEERFQAFLGDTGIALSEIESQRFVAVCSAIKTLNEQQ